MAVHSTADADAMHVKLADESVCLGPPAARDSYLNIPSLLAACEITGAEAVHPGYGFLSENARFAEILDDHGIGFIGPKAEHIRTMGDKIEAKKTALALGIPCVPGSAGAITEHRRGRFARRSRDRLSGPREGRLRRRRARHEGGHERRGPAERARDDRPARPRPPSATPAVYLEKYLRKPRHIEIQVLGDGQGRAIHLGERDCSFQRRHQKVWEESPSPALNEERARPHRHHRARRRCASSAISARGRSSSCTRTAPSTSSR